MAFHIFHINEVFSNANGSVQYIEFVGDADGQHLWAGHSIVTTHGDTSNTFNITSNLSSSATSGKSVLVATQGFADLGLVTPDFIVEDGFLFQQGGTINFPSMDSITHGALPFDGTNALDGNGQETPASPTNFAGDTAELTGIPLGDLIIGTTAGNTLTGGTGHDGIFGEGGNDTMAGGDGDDRLEGGDGADVGRGGLGNDLVLGDYGLGFGNDRLFGDAGNDTVAGDEGNDNLNGGAGRDMLFGGVGADILNGGAGVDRLNGEAGNDKLTWGAGDVINGGSNTDTLKVGVANLDLTTAANSNNKLLNLEQIDLKAGNHTLTLNRNDVLAMSPTDTVKILGDAGDTVNFVGAQVEGGAAPAGFTRYTLNGAVLIVDSDIDVI